jgi:competence protein CoiA
MPLKSLRNGHSVYAFDYAADGWEVLKAEHRKLKHLTMPCCGATATPKTSKLGTHFFAHARADGCEAPAETAEHLLAKMAVAEAVKAAGWAVDTEVRGSTPTGEDWTADVLASRGRARIAIEIQWSRQDQEETRRRQQRYAESGVRGLWLKRHTNLLTEKRTPTFRLRYDEAARSFSVLLPSPRFDPLDVTNRNKDNPALWQQTIELPVFVNGALNGALTFAPAIGRRMPVSVLTAPVDCWRCNKETRIVIEIVFEASRILKGHSNISTTIYAFDEVDGADDLLGTVFPAELLRQKGIGAIKHRYSRTAHGKYLSNGCCHCDALQGRFFDHDSWCDAQPAYAVEAELSDLWACQLFEANDDLRRWWFDEAGQARG